MGAGLNLRLKKVQLKVTEKGRLMFISNDSGFCSLPQIKLGVV